MSYPDTFRQAAERVLDRIEDGAEELASPPTHFEENDEHRGFRLKAEAGARAFVEDLRARLSGTTKRRLEQLDLDMADLVATAAQCAGWISVTGAVTGRSAARDALEEEGYLRFYPAVPGEWVACYRLVAP
jgi:hypothetical protein